MVHRTIKIRKVNFTFSHPFPNHYYKGNPLSTHFINSLHLLFPDGERYFINSLLPYMKVTPDPAIKKKIKEFCGQEGTHGREHEKFWEILEGHGYSIRPFHSHVDRLLNKYIFTYAPKIFGHSANAVITASLEHFTALFAKAAFEHIDMHDAEENLVELFLWHAAEEIEHKHVAYDVMADMDKNNHPKRLVLMPIVTSLLYGYIAAGMITMLRQDKEIDWKKMPGYTKEFLGEFLPQLHASVTKDYLDFYKKDFHPNQHDNYELATEFFKDKAYA